MRIKIMTMVLSLFGIMLLTTASLAENPIVQTNFTADPAPMVYNDTFYVYCGHDETSTSSTWFNMKEWRVYSSVDMANWVDRGLTGEPDCFYLGKCRCMGRPVYLPERQVLFLCSSI